MGNKLCSENNIQNQLIGAQPETTTRHETNTLSEATKQGAQKTAGSTIFISLKHIEI